MMRGFAGSSAVREVFAEASDALGQDLWKLFAWCVLGCLLLEKLVLAWPMLGQKTTTTTA